MKLNFRQGIVAAPQFMGNSTFLTYNVTQNAVTLDVTDGPVIATAAHLEKNYLVDERSTTAVAWGPFTWNPLWGSAPASPIVTGKRCK